MSDITFEFATRDDCLDLILPSDLRILVSERDRLRTHADELAWALHVHIAMADAPQAVEQKADAVLAAYRADYPEETP